MTGGMSISIIGIAVIAGGAVLAIGMIALVLFLTLSGGRKDEPRND